MIVGAIVEKIEAHLGTVDLLRLPRRVSEEHPECWWLTSDAASNGRLAVEIDRLTSRTA
jgi:hypothetical protein